jgi:hypothetical protein
MIAMLDDVPMKEKVGVPRRSNGGVNSTTEGVGQSKARCRSIP